MDGVCECVYVVYGLVHVGRGMHVKVRDQHQASSSVIFHIVFGNRVSHEPGAHQFD